MFHMDTELLGAAISKAVGDELRALRAKRKVSREQLKDQSGLGLSTLQRFENGERSPDLEQLAQILRVLDMPMKEFLNLALKDVEGIE